ncbi:hypothetical protein HPP92_006490 [Vanilla planifolia]|uniref:SANT domain-containing protein n=1 Tax=Vanilla planifolia TaxID=51239 RepID=A0A835RPB3_VANPL|nr:hypothetical protein HPP92_006490 [Vanilla planifolia]
MFVRAFNMYGKDFVKISEFVKTRSREHCKVFFSKARKCLGLDAIQFGSVNGATPLSDANGGRSDTDDAFVVDSAICSTQSCSKMDGEFTQSMLKSSGDAYAQTNSTTPSQPDRCDYYELGKAVPEEVDGNFGKQAFLNGETFAGDVEYPESGKDQLNSAVNLHAEDKTKPQSAAEISNKTGDTSADALSEDLKQLVGPMVDKRVQVKLENASNVDDTFFLAQNPNSTEHHCSVDKLNNDYCSALAFANHNKLHVPVESLQCIPKEPQNKPVKSDPEFYSTRLPLHA